MKKRNQVRILASSLAFITMLSLSACKEKSLESEKIQNNNFKLTIAPDTVCELQKIVLSNGQTAYKYPKGYTPYFDGLEVKTMEIIEYGNYNIIININEEVASRMIAIYNPSAEVLKRKEQILKDGELSCELAKISEKVYYLPEGYELYASYVFGETNTDSLQFGNGTAYALEEDEAKLCYGIKPEVRDTLEEADKLEMIINFSTLKNNEPPKSLSYTKNEG